LHDSLKEWLGFKKAIITDVTKLLAPTELPRESTNSTVSTAIGKDAGRDVMGEPLASLGAAVMKSDVAKEGANLLNGVCIRQFWQTADGVLEQSIAE
jgi:hypothetical protein